MTTLDKRTFMRALKHMGACITAQERAQEILPPIVRWEDIASWSPAEELVWLSMWVLDDNQASKLALAMQPHFDCESAQEQCAFFARWDEISEDECDDDECDECSSLFDGLYDFARTVHTDSRPRTFANAAQDLVCQAQLTTAEIRATAQSLADWEDITNMLQNQADDWGTA